MQVKAQINLPKFTKSSIINTHPDNTTNFPIISSTNKIACPYGKYSVCIFIEELEGIGKRYKCTCMKYEYANFLKFNK